MKKHTETPWKVYQHNTGIQIVGSRDDGCVMANMAKHIYDEEWEPEEMKANAEFIVKACNSYDALVEALDWAVKELSEHSVLATPFIKAEQALKQAK